MLITATFRVLVGGNASSFDDALYLINRPIDAEKSLSALFPGDLEFASSSEGGEAATRARGAHRRQLLPPGLAAATLSASPTDYSPLPKETPKVSDSRCEQRIRAGCFAQEADLSNRDPTFLPRTVSL